jgi:hypothetical protein
MCSSGGCGLFRHARLYRQRWSQQSWLRYSSAWSGSIRGPVGVERSSHKCSEFERGEMKIVEDVSELEDMNEPATTDAKCRRKFVRHPTNWPAVCSLSEQQKWDVVIIDASEGGFGLSCDLPVPEGTHITITIEQIGQFRASIVWQGSNRCGVKLLAEPDAPTDDEIVRLADGLRLISNRRRLRDHRIE